jgi:ABC-type multidrug transport system fused ATPase/permease subunit
VSFAIGGHGGGGPGGRGALHAYGHEGEEKAFDVRVAARLVRLLAPHWRRMAVALLLVLLYSLLSLAVPLLVRAAIDGTIAAGDAAGLLRQSALLAAVFAALFLAGAGQQQLLLIVGQDVLGSLRSRLFDHLQRLHLGYHDHEIIGVTVSRVINDVAVINQFLSQGLVTFVGDSVVLVGIVAVMLWIEPRLALLAFSVVPLMVAATWWFARRAKSAYRATRVRIAAVVGDLAENIAGMRVIQAFGREQASSRKFDEANQSNRDSNIAAMGLSFTFLPMVDFLGVLATAVVLWFGGRWATSGAVTIGTLVAFIAYVGRFFQPIQEISQNYTTMQAAMAGGEKVFGLLDTEIEIQDAPDAVAPAQLEGRIELRGVSFAYRKGLPVLHDIDLAIEPGSVVALVGPTGSGKTTIANLILRFYDATAGRVLVDGIDVRRFRQQALRSRMGLVSQNPFLFSGTIGDNIAFARPQATEAEIHEAARAANAADFIEAMPDAYRTVVREGGVNLSTGQRQLICIARAVLADPRIFILDEATASVDTLTEALIQDALSRLFAGRTSVVIAHRLSTVRRADLICVLSDGRIVDRDTHEALMARGGLYRELYERQFLDESP